MNRGAFLAHRTILRATLVSATVFGWVFAFQYLYALSESVSAALSGTLLAFALSQVIVALVTPWSAQRVRYGLRRSLVYGTLALAFAYAALGVAFAGTLGDMGLGVALFAVCMGVYRALYWTPYAFFQSSGPRSAELLIGLAPAAAGALLAWTAAPWSLLFVAVFMVLASLVPLALVGERHEQFRWGYRQTFRELFALHHRRTAVRAWVDGIESGVLLIIWPLVIFLLVDWSYAVLGAVLALTHLGIMAIRAAFGSALDRATPTIRGTLAASLWVIRLTLIHPLSIVLVDVLHKGVERGAAHDTYLDEYTALKEVALALGRMTLALTAAIVFASLSYAHAVIALFIAAAAASLYAAMRTR